MAQTKFIGMSFPDEDLDPYYDAIQSFFGQIDQNLYALMAIQQPILGGGNVTWQTTSVNPFTGILSWTSNFEIMIPGSGFYLEVVFGPDHASRQIMLNDGDRVIVTVPVVSATNVNANFSVVNGVLSPVNLAGVYTFGIYRGGVFYANLPKTFS